MNFEYSAKVKELEKRLRAFMDEHIYPNEARYYREIEKDRWTPTRIIEELKPKAEEAMHEVKASAADSVQAVKQETKDAVSSSTADEAG